MARIRILGETKLKRDATCPYCKAVGKPAGSVVEIAQEMSTGKQYATFSCNNCHEQVMMGQ